MGYTLNAMHLLALFLEYTITIGVKTVFANVFLEKMGMPWPTQ